MNHSSSSFRRSLILAVSGIVFAVATSSAHSQPAAATEAAKQSSPRTAATAANGDLADEFATDPARVSDPLERFNRAVFTGNEHVYHFVLRPIARGYERAVPRPVRKGLTNFFDNIRFPLRFVGALLQGKGGRALRETGRFAVNTVGGIGGFARVSDRITALAPEPTEDLGQAFGRWGVSPGPFIVLPLLGPSSLRDLVGRAGDVALTPMYWKFNHYDDWKVRLAVQTTDVVVAAPPLLHDYDTLRASALDPYLAVRDAYLARRAAEIRK
jgi:phospholipid-binding lipoprotein MlaA